MSYYEKSGIFKRFYKMRNLNIDRLESGKLTKRQFLEENYLLVMNSAINPFLRVDSFEMGFFNYLYYNVLAKYYEMKANEARLTKREKNYQRYINKRENYYNEKDKASLELLKYLDFKNITAYYINSDSKSLDGLLFEIVLEDYERAILHSKSEIIKRELEERGVKISKLQDSKISQYVNKKY